MERSSGLFGIADFVVASRQQVTFLDGIAAIIDWKRIEKVLQRGLGRTNEITSGPKALYIPDSVCFLMLWLCRGIRKAWGLDTR